MKVTCASLMVLLGCSTLYADPLTCNMSGYKPASGLSATAANNALTVIWDGDHNQAVRLRFGLAGGAPTIQELAVRKGSGQWAILAVDVTPDFRVVTGLRRMSNQQMAPLRGLGVELTPEIVDKYRWDPFWDAPLDLSPPGGRAGNPPPAEGVANQPGLPRKPEEIRRAQAAYHVTGCEVKTDGARLEISFPGVQLGVFSGRLQYSVFKGSNLIQQEILASTNEPWVAYKYHAGLKGLSTASGARRVARYRKQLAGLPLWRREERRRDAVEDHGPAGGRRARRRRIDRGVSAAAQFFLGTGSRHQPWIQLVPERQRHVVLVRHPPGGPRR